MEKPNIKFCEGIVAIGHDGHSFAHKPGERMANQALILEEKDIRVTEPDNPDFWYDHRRRSVVIALTTLGADPYVVWDRCVYVEKLATDMLVVSEYCYSGAYCRTLHDAITLFEDRRR